MSDYRGHDRGYDRDYDDRSEAPTRYKSSRSRPVRDDDRSYVEEQTYVERGKGRGPRDLIPRRFDSFDDDDRDYPPPSRSRGPARSYYDDDDYYDDPPRRSKSVGDRRGSSRYDRYSDEYEDYRDSRSRGGRRRDYSDSDSRSPPRRRGDRGDDNKSKSGIEGALESLGLGGIAGALVGKGGDKDRNKSPDRSRSDSRSRGGRSRYDDRSRSRSRGGKSVKSRQWAQAAQAALVAGAIEAFRARGEPGPWTGDKGKRVATAAIGAGGIDRLVDKNPDKKSHLHLVEAVIGGLAANRLANGPVDKGDGRGRSRSRSRSIVDRFRSRSRRTSRSRGGSSDRGRGESGGKFDTIKDLAAGGALAAAGKKIYDSVRSKSRSGRRRSSSASSRDSYEPPTRSRRRDRDVGSSNPRSRSMPPDESAVGQYRGNVGPAAAGAAGGAGAGALAKRADDSSSETQSSTDMENQRKKMRGKELLTAGLASVATIHAGHAVYQSMEASTKRHKAVKEGTMSVEEARKKRSKAWLQDAAAVGIAALGIKGAYSEWKEMSEKRRSVKELEERRRKRQKRRERRMREEALMNGQHPMHGGAGMRGRDYDRPKGRTNGTLPPPPMGNDRQ